MKVRNSLIVFSIFCFFFLFFSLGSVNAQNISFLPGELVNLTGIKCLNLNNSDCNNTIACNISIFYANNSILIVNQSMTILSGGFRNYNTGLTPTNELVLSAIVNCDNGGLEDFSIVIAYDEDLVDIHYWLYGSLMFFGIILSIYGFKKDKMIYIILPGMIFMLIGINIIANGFPNLDDQYLSGGVGTILLGIGASFIFHEIGKLGGVADKK